MRSKTRFLCSRAAGYKKWLRLSTIIMVRCHNFSLFGHFKSECRKPLKETTLVAAKGDDDGVHLMEFYELIGDKPVDSNGEAMEHVAAVEEKVFLYDKLRPKVWYLDTGASNHMIKVLRVEFLHRRNGAIRRWFNGQHKGTWHCHI